MPLFLFYSNCAKVRKGFERVLLESSSFRGYQSFNGLLKMLKTSSIGKPRKSHWPFRNEKCKAFEWPLLPKNQRFSLFSANMRNVAHNNEITILMNAFRPLVCSLLISNFFVESFPSDRTIKAEKNLCRMQTVNAFISLNETKRAARFVVNLFNLIILDVLSPLLVFNLFFLALLPCWLAFC